MKGRVDSQNLYWLGMTRSELWGLLLVLQEADISSLTDQRIGWVNRIAGYIRHLYERGKPFEV